MDSFQELFSGGDNWSPAGDARSVRTDNASSADSTTPPPQPIIEEKDEKKNANSIRGLCLRGILDLPLDHPPLIFGKKFWRLPFINF